MPRPLDVDSLASSAILSIVPDIVPARDNGR